MKKIVSALLIIVCGLLPGSMVHGSQETKLMADSHDINGYSIACYENNKIVFENYGDGTDWGIQKPTAGNYETITAFLNNYISMYAPSLEQEETPEMTGQSM